MSPHRDGTEPDPMLDAVLRDTLRDQSETVTAPPSMFAATQRRARQIRQRRIGGAAAASVVVVALGVGLPLGLTGGDHRDSLTPIAPTVTSTTSPTPSAPDETPTPSESVSGVPLSPTTTPSDLPLPAATGALTWTFRGDAGVQTALAPAAKSAFVAKHPGATIVGLWAGTTPSGGWSAYVFRATVPGGSPRLATWVQGAPGTPGSLSRDDILEPATVLIDQQLPADPENMLVVLVDPSYGSSKDLFLVDTGATSAGTQFYPETLNGGVAFFGLPGNAVGPLEISLNGQRTQNLAYDARLSAGGYVSADGNPAGIPEHAVNGLFQAWLAGDRTAAANYATASAISTMFAVDPTALHYAGGACTPSATPIQCVLNGRDIGHQPGLLLTVDGGVSAGYRVTSVKLGSE